MQEDLLKKYIDKTITPEELDRLLKLAAKTNDPDGLDKVLRAHWETIERKGDITDRDWDKKLEALLAEAKRSNEEKTAAVWKIHFIKRYRWVAAAAILFIASSVWLLTHNAERGTQNAVAYKGNVMPGKQGAILKLSDGRAVMIDTVKDGLIAREGKIGVYKENGQIVYKGEGKEDGEALAFNEIVTINGRQTSATLPDGSTAWLNAASSIKYPLHFEKTQRRVDMTGEVAFKVLHNDAQPFRVVVGNEMIEDKGTEFNVNAYSDEAAMKTTLLEGSLKIKNIILKPGEAYTNGKIISGNIDDAFAWRDGNFSFTHADLQSVMRQFARWYNVEIKYEGAVPAETFTGGMGRNLTLADALDALKKMHVHFRIEEDKRIVILP